MIHELETTGYRLLDGFKADFGQVTVIIGANATGKSSLLECLSVIAGSAEWPLETVLNGLGGLTSLLSASKQSSHLSWKLTFAKPQSPGPWDAVPISADKKYVYEVRLTRDAYGLPLPEFECLRNAEPYSGYAQPLKLLEATPHRSSLYDYKAHKLVPFDEVVPAVAENAAVSTPTTVPSEEMEQLRQGSRMLRLAQMRFLHEYPESSGIRILLSRFAFYPGFDVTRRSPMRTKAAEIRPVTTLDFSGDNLGTVLHEMLTRSAHRDSAEELRAFVKLAYPSVEDIFAETTFGSPPQVLVTIRETGMCRAMQLWDVSDGLLRFLCLAAALLNPVPPPVVVVEEPETGLHPRLLPLVSDMIKTAAEDRQVIISTHSPNLLNHFELDDVAVMAREDCAVRWFRPGTRASLHKLLESVAGETLGDLHESGELEALA